MRTMVALILVMCGGFIACVDSSLNSELKIESQFSRDITTEWQPFLVKNGTKASESVNSIEIYKSGVHESDIASVDRIRSLELVFNTQGRQEIDAILEAAHDFTGVTECSPYEAAFVLHVLAIDSAGGRVGYFRYYPCPDSDAGAIRPIGGDAVFFSRMFPRVMSDKLLGADAERAIDDSNTD